jgi:uncharacterized membrane protein YgcG
MNYRNIQSGHVINESYYRKLPFSKQRLFTATFDEPTHSISESGEDGSSDGMGLFTTLLIADTLMDSGSMFDSNSDMGSSSSDSDFGSSGGFGGGDFGGGGAGDSW